MRRALIWLNFLSLLQSTRGRQFARAMCVFSIGFMLTGSALRIGSFVHIGVGLDPSWIAALGEATSRGDTFGRDIIFTLGPLNSVYTRYFDPTIWRWTLGVGLLAAVSTGISLYELRLKVMAMTLLTAAMALIQSVDPLLASVPLFACAPTLIDPRHKHLALSIGAVTTGMLILVKFSIFPVAVVNFFCADMLRLRRRLMPHSMILFLSATFLCFKILQGGDSDFPDFLYYSFQASLGYTDAMSLWGSTKELVFGLILLIAVAGIICGREWVRWRYESRLLLDVIATVISFGTYIFVVWKAGFVRQDGHTLVFWGGISLASALYFQLYSILKLRSRVAGTLIPSLSVVAMCIGIHQKQAATGKSIQSIVTERLIDSRNMLRSLTDLSSDPHSWLNDIELAHQVARSSLARLQPLPPLSGSVDSVPSIQSRLIANGWDYRPQYTVQEYVGYTQALIAKNQAILESARSPENILFAPGSIDYRYPASANGVSWPEFLRFYEPREMVDGFLVLSRRMEPLPPILGPAIVSKGTLGQPIHLDQRATFLKLDIRLTLLGRVYSLLFKSPAVTMRVRYGDEQEKQYRLIPAQAREGFLVSPTVATSREYLALSMPYNPNDVERTPESITVDVTGIVKGAYAKEFTVTEQPVDIEKLIVVDAQNPLVNAYKSQP